jgi:hypothetical protein
MFKVEVFLIVTLCSVVVGYQRFRGPCCHHLAVFINIQKYVPFLICRRVPDLLPCKIPRDKI